MQLRGGAPESELSAGRALGFRVFRGVPGSRAGPEVLLFCCCFNKQDHSQDGTMLNDVWVNVFQGCLENINVVMVRWRRVMLAVRNQESKNDDKLSDFQFIPIDVK